MNTRRFARTSREAFGHPGPAIEVGPRRGSPRRLLALAALGIALVVAVQIARAIDAPVTTTTEVR
jgi:hypothetical protein